MKRRKPKKKSDRRGKAAAPIGNGGVWANDSCSVDESTGMGSYKKRKNRIANSERPR